MPTDDERSTAVVIQGPLITWTDSTLETVKIYKRIYPLSPIIVSRGVPKAKKLDELERAGAVLVASKKPTRTGSGNKELQGVSTESGL